MVYENKDCNRIFYGCLCKTLKYSIEKKNRLISADNALQLI
jgi:hypothetical protein